MYLSMLDVEKKYLFRNLELIMSKVDGDFSPEEKALIDAHCIEMHIDNNNYEVQASLDQVISEIDSSLTSQEKSIFFLELVGTIMADNVYHNAERELADRLAHILEINQEKKDEAFNIINEMKSVYEKCANYIS